GAGGAGVGVGRQVAELGEQPGQVGGGPAGEEGGDRVGAAVAGELAQRGGEGGVGQSCGAELYAAADEDLGGGVGGKGDAVNELVNQPGFSAAGLPAEQDGLGCAVPRVLVGGGESAELPLSAGEDGAYQAA